MNDENKNPVLPEDDGIDQQKLNEELEALRTQFQEKYDETVEEANNAPVIQELDITDTEEAAEEEASQTEAETEKKKGGKKKKKGLKIAAVAVIAGIVLSVIATLLISVIVLFTNPDFPEVLTTYASAASIEEYEDRIKGYESALALCKDKDSMVMSAMSVTIIEDIIVDTYENEGYSAAYAYMTSKLTAEQIAKPASFGFKRFIKVVDKVKKASMEALGAAIDNTGDSTEAPLVAELAKGLDIPEDVYDDFGTALKALSEAYIYNKSAETIEDRISAVSYYGTGYSALVSMGADSHELAEIFSTTLYEKGFYTEAVLLSSVAINPETEIVTTEYAKFAEEKAALAEVDFSIFDISKEVSNKGGNIEDIKKAVEEKSSLKSQYNDMLIEAAAFGMKAIESEEAHNLIEAYDRYITLASILESFGIVDAEVYIKACEVLYASGDITEISNVFSTYFTEDFIAGLTDDEKQRYEKISVVIASFNTVSEVFSKYYSEIYSLGGEFDYAELESRFEEILTDEADNYDKAFVKYFLYYASSLVEDSGVDTKALLDEIASLVPELYTLYGYFYLDYYVNEGNLSAAKTYADRLLENNVADESANVIVSVYHRSQGDYKASLEAALKGIELAGESALGTKNAGIACMLMGDYESAYGYLYTYYTNNMTLDSCDLLLVLDYLDDGKDEELAEALDTVSAEIKEIYTSYGAASFEETVEILDGNKTAEAVLTTGNCELY